MSDNSIVDFTKFRIKFLEDLEKGVFFEIKKIFYQSFFPKCCILDKATKMNVFRDKKNLLSEVCDCKPSELQKIKNHLKKGKGLEFEKVKAIICNDCSSKKCAFSPSFIKTNPT